jgi:hypothetical protein
VTTDDVTSNCEIWWNVKKILHEYKAKDRHILLGVVEDEDNNDLR